MQAVLIFGELIAAALGGEDGRVRDATGRQSFDVQRRQLWTSDNLRGTPEPPDPYATEDAFPRLKFFEPLSVGVVPGSNRLGMATRPGKIYTFANRPSVTQADLLIDIGRTTYGLVFHPRFAENRYFYVTYVLDLAKTEPEGSRLSRFEASRTDPPVADPTTERIILEWPSGGHNGGCMRFGPEGDLYLSTGDGSGIADELLTGQDLGDLLGAILRIDVDHPDGDCPYTIPRDNPCVAIPGARGEIWSFGHRQVWKFGFDGQGRLWAGEVGQDLWEMVYLIERGGNHGWSVNEGSHSFRPERKKGPGAFVRPVVEHPHSDFRSVTGGYVYESDRLPKLKGAYIYGYYDSGKVWSLRLDNGKVTDHRQLADTQIRIVEFAQDEAGEVYLVDFAGGGLHRLVEAPTQTAMKPFPIKLSETGLFESTRDLRPAPGLIPYSVNAPLWSDGAQKQRYLALPGNSQIEFGAVIYPHGVNYADRGWRFPDGTR
jgi:glucose/arabinose dehydrogenase